jgi:hypothetical protein
MGVGLSEPGFLGGDAGRRTRRKRKKRGDVCAGTERRTANGDRRRVLTRDRNTRCSPPGLDPSFLSSSDKTTKSNHLLLLSLLPKKTTKRRRRAQLGRIGQRQKSLSVFRSTIHRDARLPLCLPSRTIARSPRLCREQRANRTRAPQVSRAHSIMLLQARFERE